MKNTLLLIAFVILSFSLVAQENYILKENIHYYSESLNQSDDYINECCLLDVYYPQDSAAYATVVWFHGGGIQAGHKEIPEALKQKGIAVVGVNYRLHPKVLAPAYIEDAAAAVAWVFKNIEQYGGDPSLIFVSGHSAGGYLASMVGMDKHWLAHHQVEADSIAGLIPFSGHTITHFTIRKERGIEGTQAVVDEYAPIYHVRADAPPLLMITGDRELELLGRYEENAYMMRMMKVVGHPSIRLLELQGYDHGMTEPAFPLLLKEVDRITKQKRHRTEQ
ncbi:alpha/beta hydrolase [Carboxylicivirga mesophila]|uniref:Alpha/beta hydrolase n=1 Tax=Carboxylicivirga mesophila TaxID=1166478 RepID=A0ABS5KFA0_9BACT|nr:alpha/beta hydrolase [Carboxylicivirga mesophila]MBS2213467.1 alpha/beta hydrolase [Carboxylicivirga mesophila]